MFLLHTNLTYPLTDCSSLLGDRCLRNNYSNVSVGIGTIEVTANTQRVLAVSAQTGKPLRQHRPSQVNSWPTDWVPYSMVDP